MNESRLLRKPRFFYNRSRNHEISRFQKLQGEYKMSILFINGSPNKNGNTTELANTLMDGKDYRTLHLVDYKLYGYGQSFAGRSVR